MKKILLTFVFVMTMVLGASAQTDGFFRGGYDDNYNRAADGTSTPGLPNGSFTETYDQTAPLSSGLLIITALGMGYAIKKSRE